jgi:hypothetical protein
MYPLTAAHAVVESCIRLTKCLLTEELSLLGTCVRMEEVLSLPVYYRSGLHLKYLV